MTASEGRPIAVRAHLRDRHRDGAILGRLNDPKFGLNGRSSSTYVAVILAILVGVSVSALVNYTYRRARGRDVQWQFHALPAGLAVAATCVLVSRLSAFQPGYRYGVIVGVAFGGTLAKNDAGHSVVLGTMASLVIAVVAWFAWFPCTLRPRIPALDSSRWSRRICWRRCSSAASSAA